jgi:post-segregation antitoxin (ccd killing protein)
MTAATILIPTHDHGPLLRHSVRSALDQTITDTEVFIIGDGVPDVTREVVAELAEQDSRIRFFDHPKSPRHGESYRHEALASARGEIVCYLADDDLWFPDHLEEMSRMLRTSNFVNALGIGIDTGSEVQILPVDLGSEFHRRKELAGENRVPLSCGAHTRAFYRTVEGWRTTPAGTYTDLYMWQQFLAAPTCRAASSFLPTVLYLPSPLRRDWTPEQRLEELAMWAARIRDPRWVEEFRRGLLSSAMALWIDTEIYLTSTTDHLRHMVDRLGQVQQQTDAELHAALVLADARKTELSGLEAALVAAGERERARHADIQASAATLAGITAELREMQATSTWRLRESLLRFGPVRPLARAVGRVRARRGAR